MIVKHYFTIFVIYFFEVIPMIFSERLGELIKEKGVAWKVVSKELEIGINQKRYWETHGNLPDGDTLKKLSDYFGVSVPYLMGETDERGQKKSPDQMTGAGEAKKNLLSAVSSMTEDECTKILKLIDAAKQV